jgi:sulfate-transporting ATPase
LEGILGSAVACLLILSLVVLTGYTGQISLGQFALAGIGGLVAARLVGSLGVPFPIAVIGGVLATIPIGLLFALPALRTRGVNLAIITLGLGVAVNSVVLTSSAYTGGLLGITVHGINFLGLSLDPVAHLDTYVAFSVVCVVIAMLVVRNVRRSRTGRRMFAVRSNERAAASLGINPRGIKFFAFGVSAGIAALGGIVLAFSNQTLIFTSYDPLSSIGALLYATVGGIGYIGGAIQGSQMSPNALFGSILSSHFGSVANWIALIGALAVLFTLAQSPDGVTALMRRRFPARQRASDLGAQDSPVSPTAGVSPVVLEALNLCLSIGDSRILQDVSFRVDPGRIVGLIGPNGAGKTMCIDVITGFVRPSSGSVVLAGEPVTNWSPSRRAKAGMTRSFQSLELFEDIPVIDNLRVASDDFNGAAYMTDLVRPRQPAVHATALAAIEEFHLTGRVDMLPRDLSFGDRRLVSIARAVATKPSVLLLDEPASGLSDSETAELATLLTRLARTWGMGILLVEHDMSMVMSVCNEIIVLELGKTIASGTPEQVRVDQDVIKAYLGTFEEPAKAVEQDQVESV